MRNAVTDNLLQTDIQTDIQIDRQQYPCIDIIKFFCALLVAAIHIHPLTTYFLVHGQFCFLWAPRRIYGI